ncbi:MAG: UDP-2,3-diacylglucosamine diphosphatase [Kangiellaceae bacterium]|nr:UDP-2,3-diacylglucosamine diphosphatase [Kangiellaceae bacterium]
MYKTTHIISDLHLTASRPDLSELFDKYMKEFAPQSERLFVLGDLFEAWIGDDCLALDFPDCKIYNQAINKFAEYSERGGELLFIHGNRDFLLGAEFERKTGGTLLEEPYVEQWGDRSVALMHGDSLCTDDVAYQQFRQMVRNKEWQQGFLSQPIAQRVKIAAELRDKSKQAQTEKSEEIMDVNDDAVIALFNQFDIDWLIHGHTHRQAVHQLELQGKQKKRIVLSDWGEKGFYLSFSENELETHYFPV